MRLSIIVKKIAFFMQKFMHKNYRFFFEVFFKKKRLFYVSSVLRKALGKNAYFLQ